MVLQVIFFDVFAECLKPFIEKLHGVNRPMYLVPADLLRYSVEMTLKKFFRMVRSVKGSSLPDQLSLKNPALCAEYLMALFAKLAVSLSDFSTMQQHDSYFRFRLARRSEMEMQSKPVERAAKAVTPTVKFEVAEKSQSPSAPPPSNKPCAGYMGGLLGAVNKNGRPYKCDWGSSCSYKHLSPVGKSDEKLLEYAESMSPIARVDLRRAIKGAAAKKV